MKEVDLWEFNTIKLQNGDEVYVSGMSTTNSKIGGKTLTLEYLLQN